MNEQNFIYSGIHNVYVAFSHPYTKSWFKRPKATRPISHPVSFYLRALFSFLFVLAAFPSLGTTYQNEGRVYRKLRTDLLTHSHPAHSLG